MYGIRKILVGVDLEFVPEETPALRLPPPTSEAISLAKQIASFQNAEVTLLSVWEHPELLPADGEQPGDMESPSILNTAEELLSDLQAEVAAAGVTVHTRMVQGQGWMELIRDVLREQHDLVVIGSRDLRSIQRLWIGSVGTKLLRKCPCPVWIARPDQNPDVNTILVADDLGDVGERCLFAGVLAAQVLDARLLVVHALEYPLEWRLARSGISDEEVQAYRTRTRHDAEQVLHERLARTDYRTLAQGTRVEITDGPVEVVVPAAIERHEVDLLVMGTVGCAGVPGLLIGNSAERLFPEISCSLLAIKPEGFETPVKLA